MQSYEGKWQGVRARAASEGWQEGAPCTDMGHIDWMLQSCAPTSGVYRLRPRRVAVCTELLCPPLPPQDPSLIGVPTNLPVGGSIFPSDHYPVLADLDLVAGRTPSHALST